MCPESLLPHSNVNTPIIQLLEPSGGTAMSWLRETEQRCLFKSCPGKEMEIPDFFSHCLIKSKVVALFPPTKTSFPAVGQQCCDET